MIFVHISYNNVGMGGGGIFLFSYVRIGGEGGDSQILILSYGGWGGVSNRSNLSYVIIE